MRANVHQVLEEITMKGMNQKKTEKKKPEKTMKEKKAEKTAKKAVGLFRCRVAREHRQHRGIGFDHECRGARVAICLRVDARKGSIEI